MEQFFFTFISALVGASVASVFIKSRRQHIGAAAIEVLGLAFGFASSELVSLHWPELHHGWQRYVTTGVVTAWIYWPAAWWAWRIRDRKPIAAVS